MHIRLQYVDSTFILHFSNIQQIWRIGEIKYLRLLLQLRRHHPKNQRSMFSPLRYLKHKFKIVSLKQLTFNIHASFYLDESGKHEWKHTHAREEEKNMYSQCYAQDYFKGLHCLEQLILICDNYFDKMPNLKLLLKSLCIYWLQ